MAAITVRRNILLLPIKPLFSLQVLFHKLAEGVYNKPKPLSEDDYLIFKPGEVDVSKWKKVDSRSLGITRNMVPVSPYTVMHILRIRGFEAYLVGGCVRDLILNRTPKDFDVITTADLNQISKQFHKCEVVGQRFPVCRVYMKGSVVEVSSFDTMAKDAEGKEKFLKSQMPSGCDKLDLIRWKNSMHRDFTINGLFFDPFLHKIYDYNDGMKDLSELKLRTLVPAQLSFTEDSARILRGLRIAARVGLSLSKEIKSAILKQRSSISKLGEFRISMELNYMLSYGAAESSMYLLHKYHLLDILLPYQAAYISQQETRSGQSSTMLMKLLSHLDRLVTCDHPSGSRLWVGLLGFHLALVDNPQHPFVILSFASALYHQSWEDGLKFARKNDQTLANFEHETLEPYNFTSDDEVAEKVTKLAMAVVDSIDLMTETDPDFANHGLVCIPRFLADYTKQLFHVLAHKVETYKKGRSSYEINYDLLKKGDSLETRFTLAKIILNTIGCGVNLDRDSKPNEVSHHAPSAPKNEHLVNRKDDKIQLPIPYKLDLQPGSAPKEQKVFAKLNSIMQKRSDQNEYKVQRDGCQSWVTTKHTEVVGISSNSKYKDCMLDKPKVVASNSQMQELICMLETVTDNKKSPSQLKVQNLDERCEENTEVKVYQSEVKIDETEVGSLSWYVQTNCNRAIDEARDSPPEMRKLNQFLVNFVDEQLQRKKGKLLEASSLVSSVVISQTESMHLDTCSSITSISCQQIDVDHSGASSLVSSSIGISEGDSKQLESSTATSQTESMPQICVQHAEDSKTKSGKKKKQRVCSYCKEVGHNRIGCPKRKLEEASSRIATESI